MVAQHSRKKKVALGVIITLVCVVVAVLIGFNLYIRIAYSSFTVRRRKNSRSLV